MKRQVLFTFLAMLVSMAAYCQSIEVKNADGVTIAYSFTNNMTELSVTYRGDRHDAEWYGEYTGNVVIPASVSYNGTVYPVTSVGDYAFNYCKRLASVSVPNSVTSIGSYAFYGCETGLHITIPASVTSIGNHAFDGYPSLRLSIRVDDLAAFCNNNILCKVAEEMPSIQLIDSAGQEIRDYNIPDGVTNIGNGAFEWCNRLSSVTISNSVTNIGTSAFAWCSSLNLVAIGNNVKTIDSGAFSYCQCLTDVYCYAKEVPSTNSNVFQGTDLKNATLHVPAASFDAYITTTPWRDFKTIEVIPGTEPPIFKLIYMVDDAVYRVYEIEEGVSIIPEPAPTKEGYTFSGWDNIPATMPAEDVVINGSFTINKILGDNAIGADNVMGFVGSNITLPILMKNTESIIGMQFDLTLPEGVSVVLDNDNEYMFLLTNRAASSHSIIAEKMSDGSYRILVSSLQNSKFKGTEGVVMEAMLAIANDMLAGEYPVKIANIEMTTAQNIAIRPDAFVSKLIVQDIMSGDANCDGTVSVTDVTMTISHILGQTPDGFNAEAADVNGDGSVSVTDVTIMIDMILKQK